MIAQGRERDERQPQGFLGRLARDRRGNTLAMMAMALVPLTGMAGSAIDTARVYYVKVRLQQACDAGVLAGRKTMDGTDFNTNAYQQAQAFFGNNFNTGMLGSQTPSFTPVRTTENQVAGTASVVVPMTLTKLMGMSPVTISVACEAKLEIPNLDVMFVLDTTGSMMDTNNGDTQNKITALRASVINFYDTVEAAKKTGTRTRYGFVPYATNVNVGMLLKPDWMVNRWTYQSRVPDGTGTSGSSTDNNQWVADGNSAWRTTGSFQQSSSPGSTENCVAPANVGYTSSTTYTTWEDAGNGRQVRTRTYTQNGTAYTAAIVSGACQITKTQYSNYVQKREDYQKPNPNYGKTTGGTPTYKWWYKAVEFDVSTLKGSGATMAGGQVTQQVGNNHQMRSASWNASNACIEERRTVKQASYDPYPTTAYDLDIDMIPNPADPETQWKPLLPAMVFARPNLSSPTPAEVRGQTANYPNMADNGSFARCPSPAVKLSVQARTTFTNYVNGLQVGGNTYHDIGFLWGTRLLSPTGLFASENNTAPNGSDISRHLIFMTDGETQTSRLNYEAYGLSAIDQRRTNGMPTDADQDTIVANRLSALCTAAKRKNITVWVIAFGTSLNTMLSNCASDGRSFQANNAAQLNQTFSNIAAQIAKLRVSR